MAKAIPNVCENNKDRLKPFINVDFPPAFGPVNTILFGNLSPMSIELLIIVFDVLFFAKYGCHISLKLIL